MAETNGRKNSNNKKASSYERWHASFKALRPFDILWPGTTPQRQDIFGFV